MKLYQVFGPNWKKISSQFDKKREDQLKSRMAALHAKKTLSGTKFSDAEDRLIMKLYKQFGKDFNAISKMLPGRSSRQIRDRFQNHLKVQYKFFTVSEDVKLLNLMKVYPNDWEKISTFLKGKTPDMVKARYYSHLSTRTIKDLE
jgi:hypothetical protein